MENTHTSGKQSLFVAVAILASVLSSYATIRLAIDLLAPSQPVASAQWMYAFGTGAVFELAKYGFLISGLDFIRSPIPFHRTLGRTMLWTALVIFAVSIVATCDYVSTTLATNEAADTTRKESATVAKVRSSDKYQDLTHDIASAQSDKDTQLAAIAAMVSAAEVDMNSGYKTRAAEQMTRVERMRGTIREIDERLQVLQAKRDMVSMQVAAGAVVSPGIRGRLGAMGQSLLAVLLEIVCVVALTAARMTSPRRATSHVTRHGRVAINRTQSDTIALRPMVPVVPVDFEGPITVKAVREHYRCGQAKATQIARRLREARGNDF